MTDRQIFLESPTDASPEVLEAYLDQACGADPRLRSQVEALIDADQKTGGFLSRAPLESDATLADDAPLAEEPGDMIGNHKLLQKIGEGGFGVVYMADQLRPVKRRVALKIIKLGMDTRQVVARFEAERQALAMMDHPNIAKIFDAGATDTGRPYFVMELVRGIPITKFCDENNLSTEDRLNLFIEVCRAVQHAHQKGIIHRDLKPSNVMVTMHDDKPVPKVIDFGIAKATQADLTEKTLYTRYEQFIGTPAYMSPEQAQMSGLDIDTRSDIYSLGVLLYELLTGRTPFDNRELFKAGQDEIRRVIREDEPPKPSARVSTLENAELTKLAKHRKAAPDRLHTLLRGDLDWIIMMALEKDRTRRYETANGLAMDILRHLENEPVTAAAPGPFYRLGKYVRRHRKAVSITAVVTTLLIAATVVITLQAVDKRKIQDDLDRAAFEHKSLEMEKRSIEFRKEQRGLTRSAIAVGQWAVARENVREFLRYPDRSEGNQKNESFDLKAGRSLDRVKFAALNLKMGNFDLYQNQCLEMIGERDPSRFGPVAERTVRAYFAVPRSADDPQALEVLNLAGEVEMPHEKHSFWEGACRGIASYRMGRHEVALSAFYEVIQAKNLMLQVTIRPYLAMVHHHLGNEADAQRVLVGAGQVLNDLESKEPSNFWHERVLGRMAYEEALQLIAPE